MSHIPATVRNVVWNWGGYASSIVISFFLSPFVVHHLGDAGYGVWVLMISVTGYLGFLDLGVRGAVTRYVSKFHTQGDHTGSSRIASSALTIFSGAGVTAVLASFLLALLAVDRFHIPSVYRHPARIVLVLSGFSVALTLVGGVFGGILTALQRFDLSNAIGIASTLLRALATVLVLEAGQGIVALAWVQLLFTAASVFVTACAAFWLYPELRLTPHMSEWASLGLIFSFSVASFLFNVSAQVIYYTDAIVIGAFLPVALITYFSIAGNLMNYSRALISGISFTMTPLASSMEAAGRGLDLQRVALKAPWYATALMLPIAATFMIRGESFIRLWMGPRYAELSGRVLWVLALPLVFSAATQVLASVMFGISKHTVMMAAALIEGACNLLLSVALVRRMGIEGVAWGTTVPNLVASLIFWPWYVRRTMGIHVWNFVSTVWLRPGFAALPFILVTFVIDRFWYVSSLALFFLQVGMALPLVLLGYWFLCFTPEQRRSYSQGLGALVRNVLP